MSPRSSFRSRRPGHACLLAALVGLAVISSVIIGGCAEEKMPDASQRGAAGSAASDLVHKPPIAPTFPTQFGRTFFNSVDNLFAFGKAMAMVIVAVVPWLPLILAGLFILRWLIRANRSSRMAPRHVTPAQPKTT